MTWDVHPEESTELAADLAERACHDQGVDPRGITLHSDNGGPMKGSTMLATLRRVGIAASFSPSHVSDDNAVSEALFRTLKISPQFSTKAPCLPRAGACVADFVAWYNLHSGIRYVTRVDRHDDYEADVLACRKRICKAARARAPKRWSELERSTTETA